MIKLDTIYPTFFRKTRLILQPWGATVLPLKNTGEPFTPGDEIDRFGFEILRHIDGRTSLATLLERVDASVEADDLDVGRAALDFIQNLSGDLRFYSVPVARPVSIVGDGTTTFPTHVSIELTDHCNLVCRHCYRNSSPALKTFIPTGSILQILDELCLFGVKTVELTGGEPMTHPDFDTLFERAATLFNLVPIVSNGTLIDASKVSLFSRFAKRMFVQVDLDGDSADVHEDLRRIPGSFANVCTAIQLLAAAGVPFRVVMNVYPKNLSRIRATAALARSLGASTFTLTPVLPLGRGSSMDGLKIEDEDLREYARVVTELESEDPGFIHVSVESRVEHSQPNKSCGAGSKSLVIGPDGNVRPCLMMEAYHGVLGSVLDTGYAGFLGKAALLEHSEVPAPSEEYCGDCRFGDYCKGCITRPMSVIKTQGAVDPTFRCYWNEKVQYYSGVLRRADSAARQLIELSIV